MARQQCQGQNKCELHDIWTRKVNEKSMVSLPLFSGKANSGFASSSFHPSFFATNQLVELGLLKGAIAKAFADCGTVSLGDTLLLTPQQLMLHKNVSTTVTETVRQNIRKLLLTNTWHVDTTSPERFVRSLLGPFLNAVTEKNHAEIVVQRLLGHSLGRVAKNFGTSREWVRICVQKARRSLKKYSGIHNCRIGLEIVEDVFNRIGDCGTPESICLKMTEVFGWNSEECTPSFVSVVLDDIFRDSFTRFGQFLYRTHNFPCIHCEKMDEMILEVMEGYCGKWSKLEVATFISDKLAGRAECKICRNGQPVSTAFIRYRLASDSTLKSKMRAANVYKNGDEWKRIP